MSSWKVCTVEELVKEGILEKPLDGNHGSIHPKSTDYTDDGIPFIMASDLVSGRVDLESCKFISKDMALSLRKGFAKEGDVLLSHKATIGRTALIQSNKFPFIVLTPQVTYYRVKNNKKLNNVYLKNYFDSYAFQSILNQWAGSGSTRAYIGITDQLKLPIVLPPYQEQEKIADILGSFDDKIQLNTQTNQTLEQIAQAIFKSWFVDFDPVKAKIDALANGGTHADAERAAMQVISGKTNAELTQMQQTNPDAYKTLEKTAALFPSEMVESELGDVPKGWDRDIASNLFDISIGKTPPRKESEWFSTNNKDIPWLSIRDMGGNEIFSSLTSEYLTKEATDKFNIKIAPKNTVFLSFKLTVGRVSIASTEMCTNEAIAHFLQQEHSLSYFWLYCYLKNFNFESLGSTSSIATAVNSKTIKNLPIIYHDLLVREFHKKVTPIFNKILGLEQEIENLVKIRDALLPKLLSGDIY
ncbi:restriction endonuclease subunit S, partial [Pasteurella multocida]